MGLVGSHCVFPGCPGFCFLAGFTQGEALERDCGWGREKPGSFPFPNCYRECSCKAFPRLAPASTGQPIFPITQLTLGTPMLWIQFLTNSPDLWALVMTPPCGNYWLPLVVTNVLLFSMLWLLSPSSPVWTTSWVKTPFFEILKFVSIFLTGFRLIQIFS